MTTSEPPQEVIFAWTYDQWGGAEVQFLHLARHAPPGWTVNVIAPVSVDAGFRAEWDAVAAVWRLLPRTSDLGRRSSWFGPIGRRIRELRVGNSLVAAQKLLEGGNPVHLDVPIWLSMFAVYRIARRRPIVLTWHTPMPRLTPLRRLLTLSKLRCIGRISGVNIVGASDTARVDAMHWFGADAVADFVGVAGFDPDEIETASNSARGDVGPGLRLVGVGALTARKGIDVAIESVALLVDRGIDVRLTWCGRGPEREQLEGLADRLGVADRVQIRSDESTSGHRQRLLETVAASDIYVQPSRIDGLPLAILEAMAMGRAVVATRVGAIGELDDGNGSIELVESDDAHGLAETIERLAGDELGRREIGERGQALVRARYDMRTAAPDFYRWLEHLGQSGSSCRSRRRCRS